MTPTYFSFDFHGFFLPNFKHDLQLGQVINSITNVVYNICCPWKFYSHINFLQPLFRWRKIITYKYFLKLIDVNI